MNSIISSSPTPSTYVKEWSNLESIKKIQYNRLGHTDMFVSLISFGAAHVGRGININNNDDDDDDGGNNQIEISNISPKVIDAICQAIRLGINLVDTSPFYGMGLSEIIVGQALKKVPRQAYYLSTKIGRHSDCNFDYSRDAIRKSIDKSLKKLNLNYVDIVHVHDVEFCPLELLLRETLPELERLRLAGKIRYIGISGYPLSLLREIVEKSSVKIDIILSYCRHSLWDNEFVNYLDYFKSKNIGIINAAIFGMGLLGNDNSTIPEWHPASKKIRDRCQRAREICMANGSIPLTRLALRYSLHEKRIDTHLIGMESIDIVNSNLSAIIGTNSNDVCKENELLDLILRQAFGKSIAEMTSSSSNENWEQIEVDRYRQNPEEFIQFLRQCWSGTVHTHSD
nr:L-galactose dehydrogenase-like [Dermatophagoides farinae]